MSITSSALDELTLTISQDIQVNAPLDATFDAILEQMGPHNETGDGTPMPMILEPRPGGRWVRDLGNDNGHLWGHVQAIKRPTLLEISGPLFMSYAAVSNIQYRLTANKEGTLITFRHTALGMISDDHRSGLTDGWTSLLDRVAKAAAKGGTS